MEPNCIWTVLLFEWIGIGLLAGVPVTFVILFIVFPMTGFCVGGVLAGSMAACCQSRIGNVASGSCFACK